MLSHIQLCLLNSTISGGLYFRVTYFTKKLSTSSISNTVRLTYPDEGTSVKLFRKESFNHLASELYSESATNIDSTTSDGTTNSDAAITPTYSNSTLSSYTSQSSLSLKLRRPSLSTVSTVSSWGRQASSSSIFFIGSKFFKLNLYYSFILLCLLLKLYSIISSASISLTQASYIDNSTTTAATQSNFCCPAVSSTEQLSSTLSYTSNVTISVSSVPNILLLLFHMLVTHYLSSSSALESVISSPYLANTTVSRSFIYNLQLHNIIQTQSATIAPFAINITGTSISSSITNTSCISSTTSIPPASGTDKTGSNKVASSTEIVQSVANNSSLSVSTINTNAATAAANHQKYYFHSYNPFWFRFNPHIVAAH
ncbi:BEM_collapsed_G0045520.mRNA.1.CDS.1 [Saccharomyces cerevisiae]|nr:BEM_collapsed_G0045520.mRNA.1.CDS.1 [Saccharomyces cerevisiae]